jgi:homocysteine S-methyltransferase
VTCYRARLPQLGADFFVTDGGIETTLMFLERLDLPEFAAFDLLKRADGEAALRRYFRSYATLARRFGTGLILESPTWRASADWGARLGYDSEALSAIPPSSPPIMRGSRSGSPSSR